MTNRETAVPHRGASRASGSALAPGRRTALASLSFLTVALFTEAVSASPVPRTVAASAKIFSKDTTSRGAPDELGSPLTQLRESDAALINLLRKRVPSWSPEAGLTEDRLRRLLAGLLDYRKMAERVMGPTWRTMDSGQQKVFIDVFATLTNQAFVSAASRPTGRVRYLSETVLGTEARVSAAPEHPIADKGVGQIEYHLSRNEDRWLIYDVVVDGVSLTESYQDQLQNVLRREGFDQLIARMRRRIDARARD